MLSSSTNLLNSSTHTDLLNYSTDLRNSQVQTYCCVRSSRNEPACISNRQSISSNKAAPMHFADAVVLVESYTVITPSQHHMQAVQKISSYIHAAGRLL
jgi:hypothetical protein